MVKGLLNKDTLQSNGITFNRKVIGPGGLREILGEQAEILATRLLDFHRFAPQERAKPLLESKDRNLFRRMNDAIKDPHERQALKKLKDEFVVAHSHIMKIAVATESRWMDAVQTLFDPMIQRARDIEGASTIGVKKLAKSLRVDAGAELIWDAAHRVRSETAPPDAPKLTRPKPDFFISLPTFKEYKVPRGFAREPSMGNFCVEKLQLLEDNMGLVSSPLRPTRGKRTTEKDFLCFPGMILEAKHHKPTRADIEKCYCQAVNGAACALALLNGLTCHYSTQDIKREMRPVVVITLSGHKTRLWIAGMKPRKLAPGYTPIGMASKVRECTTTYHMQCIWKGDLQNDEPLMELVCIIDSIEKWLIDDFRPWVSGCLGRHYDEIVLEAESSEEAENDSSDDDEGEVVGNTSEYNDSELSDEYEHTDEEEKEWDENWIVTESEESESGLDSDDEEYPEYLKDLVRADSLMEQLSLNDSPKSGRRVSHRFIERRRELGI